MAATQADDERASNVLFTYARGRAVQHWTGNYIKKCQCINTKNHFIYQFFYDNISGCAEAFRIINLCH